MFSFHLHCRERSWTWTSYSFPWPVARKYENSSLQIYLVYLAGPVLVVFVLLTRLQFPPFLKDIIQSKVNIYASFRNYRNQCNFPVVVSQDRCYLELQMLLSHCPISVSNWLLCVHAWLQFKEQVLGGKATWYFYGVDLTEQKEMQAKKWGSVPKSFCKKCCRQQKEKNHE